MQAFDLFIVNCPTRNLHIKNGRPIDVVEVNICYHCLRYNTVLYGC